MSPRKRSTRSNFAKPKWRLATNGEFIFIISIWATSLTKSVLFTHRLNEEIMALKVAAQETKEALAESQGNVLDAKNERAQMGRCVGLVGVAAAYIVLNRASK